MKRRLYEQEQARKVKIRFRMLQHAQKISHNVSQTCRFFGISRAQYYIPRIDEKELSKLSPRILQMFQGAPGDEQLLAAKELARHGIKCEPVVPILVLALKELPNGGIYESYLRFSVLEAMSCIKGEPQVVEALKQVYQYGSGGFKGTNFKDWALCALGAIGEPGIKPLIEYAAEQGNPHGGAALKLFGIGTFSQIKQEAIGSRPTVERQQEAKASSPPAEKKSGCFIATVVFEDAHAPEVIFLRSFRDRYLLTNRLGRLFVVVYERVGPPLSKGVSRSPALKAIARAGIRGPLHILHPDTR